MGTREAGKKENRGKNGGAFGKGKQQSPKKILKGCILHKKLISKKVTQSRNHESTRNVSDHINVLHNKYCISLIAFQSILTI